MPRKATALHDIAAPDNHCYKWAIGDKGPGGRGFCQAAHVTKLDLVNNRLMPNAMEPRAAIGSYNRASDEYTLYVANQNPHVERLLMTAFVLGLPEHKVRVIAPDVGGGFGSKIFLYAEDVCLTWAAKKLNRNIKWTADRSEVLPQRRPWPRPREPRRDGDGQGRQVPGHARAHRRQPGRLPLHLLQCGAHHPVRHAAGGPVHHAADLCGGGRLVHQHRAGGCLPRRRPARGHLPAGAPGQPLRWELGLSQDEIRKRNFITSLPYQTPVALQYDVGDYHACMTQASKLADVAGFAARRRPARPRA
jgi:carbon-monoxide dehydrogenase large subunit